MLKKDTLSERQERFCREYLVDLDPIEAAKRVGFKDPKKQGPNLLQLPLAKEFIKQERARIIKKMDVSIERCIQEYSRIAFFDIAQVFNDDGTLKRFTDMSENARRAIQGFKIFRQKDGSEHLEVKLCDKKGSLDSIMKHLGGFDEKIKIELPEAIKVLIAILPLEWQERIGVLISEKYKLKDDKQLVLTKSNG